MPEHTTTCPRCGSTGAVTLFHNPDYISGESFAVLRCATCGLVRTDFPYRTQDLGRYYGEAYFGSGGRRFVPVMEWLVRRFRQARANMILRHYPHSSPGTVLDVGCGRGLMLIDFKQRGWTCLGTEFSEELAATLQAEHAITVYTAPRLADNHLPAESVDIVVLWHSLEHQTVPSHTLAECVRVLRPGGLMVVEVPNLASVQARIGRGRWFHLDTPRHVVHFSAETLRDSCQAQGLAVIDETTLSLEQGFYGMIQTLLNRVTTTPNVLYTLLKKKRPRGGRGALLWNVGLTVGLLPLAVSLGTALEAWAAARRRGAVIRLVLSKPDGP